MAGNSLVIYDEPQRREICSLLGLKGTTNEITLLFKLAEHYQLDVLTKEIALIPGKGPFIGVWGRIHIAHRSGKLDGTETDDEWETEKHYCVRCIVWHKDMHHPAAKVIGRVAKTEGSTDRHTGEWKPKEWPLEVARARGLRTALGYAFSIHDAYDADDGDDDWAPAPDERLQASVMPPTDIGEEDNASSPTAPTPEHGEVPPGPPADPTRTVVVGGHSLAERLAIAAKKAGIDDDPTRHDVIYAATAGTASRGHDVDQTTADRCFEAFAGLADGTVELRYKPDGTPTLIRPRKAQT